MEQLLSSIERSLAAENWLSALFMAICLPDICGAAEKKIKANGLRYQDWFNRYLKERYDSENPPRFVGSPYSMSDGMKKAMQEYQNGPTFTAIDCWKLRNACLHEGMDEDEDKDELRRFKFSFPTAGSDLVHMNKINDILQLDVKVLCEDIIKAVRKWIHDVDGDAEIKQRLDKIISVKNINEITFHG